MTLTVHTPSAGLAEHAARTTDPLGALVQAWLYGQRSPRTVDAYRIAIQQWLTWCAKEEVPPLGALRVHVEAYQRHLEQLGKKPRTIYARLTAVASWYTYLIVEDVITRDPMRGVKRPTIERRSPTAWLSRSQLADFVMAVKEHQGVYAHALVLILALNGLRIGEACSLNISSIEIDPDGYSPVLVFIRKGGKYGRAVLSRPVEQAVMKAVGDRREGPLLLNEYGNRMTQQNAQLIIDKAIPHVRGTHGRITPHALRHSWCTAGVDSGVPLDQLQHDGGWSDPRLIPYYSHGMDRADRAVTHAVTAYVMGAA